LDKTVLIVGYGSIGRRHADILNRVLKIKKIYILTKQICKKFNTIKNLEQAKLVNPDYIIICSNTADHLHHLLFFEKNFFGKIILVEKPLFSNFYNIKIKNNKVFIGYNLRYSPVIQKIKNKIKNQKIYSLNVFCSSYLPYWRANRDYRLVYSAKRKLGGGVLLDMSHELDYIQWIFGKIKKILYKKISKVSDLDVDVEDSVTILAKIKKINLLINLNFFSKINKREVIVDGKNINIKGDLIKNTLEIYSLKKNKPRIINFSRNVNISYINMHKDLLSKNYSTCCSFDEGKNINYLIDKIKKNIKL
jgi:CMP-N,N'-diacetyllegionaminic acid synthase